MTCTACGQRDLVWLQRAGCYADTYGWPHLCAPSPLRVPNERDFDARGGLRVKVGA